MFRLQINSKNIDFAFSYNIFIQSNLKSLKSSEMSRNFFVVLIQNVFNNWLTKHMEMEIIGEKISRET